MIEATEDTFVQLFWSIALPVLVCAVLVVGGIVHHLLVTPEYRRFLRLQKAKQTWAKMLTQDTHRPEA